MLRLRVRAVIDRFVVPVLSGVLVVTAAVVAVIWMDTARTCLPDGAVMPDSELIGYLAYWDQQRGLASLAESGGALTQVSPSWYSVLPGGGIAVQEAGRVDDSDEVVSRLREHAALVVPVITNLSDGTWDGRVVEQILGDPSAMRRHVDEIGAMVTGRGFDGIDIDYEHLSAGTRLAFGEFVDQLAAELHARGKRLSVTVHPKTEDQGPHARNQAQDYAAIGKAADEVRVMLYDYHWDSSEEGPLAPIDWARSVMEFAVTQVPPCKLIMGLGTYGYDWVAGQGESLMWQEIDGLVRAHQPLVLWDEATASPWFTYEDDDGRQHQVWFENARSLRAKAAVARELRLAGVHLWRLGGNDPSIWSDSGIPTSEGRGG